MLETRFERSRIISFIDAVFSIAMTLLVLEVAIPTYEAVNVQGTWTVLGNLVPNFIGFVVSFLVTALYWVAQLRIMTYVEHFDNKLLWLNILLLFFVVLMPFSTSFYVGGFTLLGPFVFYSFNLSAIGFFNYLIVRYVVNMKSNNGRINKVTASWERMRALNSCVIWVIAGLTAFVFPTIARFTFILIFVFQAMINAYYKKRMTKST
jgi:uncharacterized membrane protein